MTIRPKRTPVFVCRKCVARHPKGRKLQAALKHGLKSLPAVRSRMVLTSCFGICPKRAIVAASRATLASASCLLVARQNDVGEAISKLIASTDNAGT